MRMLKTVIIIAMVANVLMFATNAIQTKTAHADLDSDQMHYSIRLCVKNVIFLSYFPYKPKKGCEKL